MIEQRASVIRVEGDDVWIRTEPQTGCHSCAAKSGCGSGLVAQFFPARVNQELRLSRRSGSVVAAAGDRVILGIEENHLQKTSLLLYAFPLFGLLCGAIAGQMLMGTELASILGGLSGLSLTLYFIRSGARRLSGLAPDAVRILRVEKPQANVRLDIPRRSSEA